MKAVNLISTRNCFKTIIRNRSTEPTRAMEAVVKAKSPTIDIEDVSRFSQISETWWNISGEMKPLHALNPLRIQFIRDGLANIGHEAQDPCQPLEGISIIEVGCGGGILSEPLARIGANMTGIDPSVELIKCAKKHAALDSSLSKRLNYIQTSVEELAQSNSKKYDAVVASEVLEHVADQETFLKYCTDLLRPGGSIFLTTMNKTFPSWLGGIIAAEYILKLVPIGTHDWNKFISPRETRRLLEKYNCRTKLVHGMVYNPLKNEWYWSSLTPINYAIHAIKKVE
ncbi:ubiquinone biosynthesis O-methyltransferase, mitochondrial-like [Leptopilina heterotoma]|uniref:ubiquinone biosynthesis O-methyltransferase, mitochondrial-like n=1 Tax=Leptopilina heterotoma TaxID=63436 RepID=UPI001CA82F10|nr:ubiquinone biosynthesis O-methyltransferase, mitochondrial-like [Leptopilina heterotoma]